MNLNNVEAFSGMGEAPLYTGFLRGYRIWRISTRHGDATACLRSTSQSDYFWTPGTVEVASCGNVERYRTAIQQLKAQQNETLLALWNARSLSSWHREVLDNNLRELTDRLTRMQHSANVLRGHRTPSAYPPCRSCGLYAFHHPDRFSQHNGTLPSNFESTPGLYLLGSVKATGTIVIGAKGMRAEKMEIEALTVGFDVADIVTVARLRVRRQAAEQLQHFGRLFKVPVYSDMRWLLKEHPPTPLDGIEDTGGWEARKAIKAVTTMEEDGPAPAMVLIPTAPAPAPAWPVRSKVLEGTAWITDLKTQRRTKVFGVNISFREDYSNDAQGE